MPTWTCDGSYLVTEKSPDDGDWCTGLFVGEGSTSACLRKSGTKVSYGLYLQIGMYDQGAINRWARWANVYAGDAKQGRWAPGINVRTHYLTAKPETRMYRVQITGKRAERVARAMLPLCVGTIKYDQLLANLAKTYPDVVDHGGKR